MKVFVLTAKEYYNVNGENSNDVEVLSVSASKDAALKKMYSVFTKHLARIGNPNGIDYMKPNLYRAFIENDTAHIDSEHYSLFLYIDSVTLNV